MKKTVKIGSLIFVIFVLIVVVGTVISKWKNGPTQSFTFLNSGYSNRSVTFERIEKEGKLEDSYMINNELNLNQYAYDQVPIGKYLVSVWNSDKTLFNSFEFDVVNKESEKDLHQPIRLDLAMDKMYTIVNLNALYEGESFAEFMSNAAGTKQSKIKFEKFYDGSLPFFVADEYASRTFVDIDDEIPSKVKYGEMVYGLFAFPKNLPKDQVEAEIYLQIGKKLK